MERVQDARSARTCRALWLALVSLLKKCSFEEITVLKLCEEAGIKRATFYLHYKDLDQFVNSCLTDVFNESFPYIAQENPYPKREEYLVGLFKTIIAFLDENREVVSLILSKTNTTLLYKLFDEALSNEMTNKAVELTARGYVFKVPARVAGEYYAGAYTGLIKWWLLSGEDISKEELENHFRMLLSKDYVIRPNL